MKLSTLKKPYSPYFNW